MTAKEYLSQYRYINININNKIAQQKRLRELATCVSPSSDGCGHNSGVSDKVGSLCAKIADLDAEINAEIDKLVDVQKDIMQTISKVDDERLRVILTERYIGCKTFEQIADDIHYSYMQTFRLHGQALLDELREAWNQLYCSPDNRAMVLNNGVKFQEGSNSAVDLQLNQNKVTNAQQIALIFGLSPDVIGGNASTDTYMSSIKTGVLPVVQALQTAINRAMLLEEEKQSMYFVVDTAELLKGDIRSRYEAYRIGLEANFLQPDEVRYKEDMPPLGLNFIKLGLNDVLYDPVSKTFYTPNTNQHATMTGNTLQNEENRVIITEKRYNPNRDEKGRFAEGSGNGNGKIKSITVNDDGTFTVVREPQSNTKYSPSPQRNHGGIQVKPKTYAKLCGEFNTKYPNASKNTKGIIYDRKYMYRAKADGEGGIIISQKRILK